MEVTALLVVVIVLAFIIALALGVVWFIAVPVAVALLLLPLAYTVALMSRGRSSGPPPEETTGLPSTEEASYEPVRDPSEPGSTPR